MMMLTPLDGQIAAPNHVFALNGVFLEVLGVFVIKEALPLPDQVDEAINYIKSLETNIMLAKEKKESLMGNKKRSRGGYGAKGSIIKLPKIEIHEMGPTLQVIVTCGVDKHFIFCEIMRILHEENVEVISSNSSLTGDSLLHTVHAQIPQTLLQFGATKISERLKEFVNGSMSDVETESQVWDLEIGSESWELLHYVVTKSLPNP
ncbi:transcription factor bHLH162 [Medicago truncatula]|uniref:transcription factor bHLH162 n=1 Tax=Medicago truncatula TaxID=3880 RepID=UPI000D2F386F|nr:transcription factor bHLH162 [Medicago truncatula]